MGHCYGQLRLEERVEIYRLHSGGKSQNEIAAALGRSASTVSRELRRNARPSKAWAGGYDPVRAQRLAERRRRWDGRFKLARQPGLRDCVGTALAMGHSPEQIAGRLAREPRTWSPRHQPRVNLPLRLPSQRPEGLVAPPPAAP